MTNLADRIHIFAQTIISILAITFNAILLLAIKKRTPASMRAYSIFLSTTAVIDMITAFWGTISCGRAMSTADDQTIQVYLGPCSLISNELCNMSHAFVICLPNQSTLLIVLSFGYRLYILNVLEQKGRNGQSGLVIGTICAASTLLSAVNTYMLFSVLQEVSPEISHELNIENYATTLPKLETLKDTVAVLVNAVTSPLLICVIYILRKKLMKRIRQTAQSERVQHDRIAKTLTYQSLLPVGSLLAVTYWSLDKHLPITSELPQRLMIMAMSINCLVSPIINLFYLPSYRKFLVAPDSASTSVARIL